MRENTPSMFSFFRGWRLPPHVRQCYAAMVARSEPTTAKTKAVRQAFDSPRATGDRQKNPAHATPGPLCQQQDKPDKDNSLHTRT